MSSSLGMQQHVKMSQQLTMTPQLQQAIKILQLSRLDLEQFVHAQMIENPVLEEKGYGQEEPLAHLEKTTEKILGQQLQESSLIGKMSSSEGSAGEGTQQEQGDVDWEVLARQKEALQTHRDHGSSRSSGASSEVINYEQVVSAQKTLTQHLLEQVGLLDMSEGEKRGAREIIGNLDDKGYFKGDLKVLAEGLRISLEDAEAALKHVHSCDPLGVGARSLVECLMLQLHAWGQNHDDLRQILTSHLSELERKNYPKIAKSLSISEARVRAAVNLLAELEPVPARPFTLDPSPHISVDVHVILLSGKLHVVPHDEGLPRLQISSYYQEMMAKVGGQKKSKKERMYLQEKIQSASWLIRSLHKRQSTILKVSEAIVEKQKDFFFKGTQYLRPMVLKDIAEEIDVHESTVSRVSAGKYMLTPRGVFELRYFFNAPLQRRALQGQGQQERRAVASESVKQMVKKIFAEEDAMKPLSDEHVSQLLQQSGIQVARRTVAKYREQLGILPSSRRRRFAS